MSLHRTPILTHLPIVAPSPTLVIFFVLQGDGPTVPSSLFPDRSSLQSFASMDAKIDSSASSAFPPSVASVPIPVPYPDQSITKGALSTLWYNPLTAAVNDAYQAFSERRSALGLSNPGTVDGISREVTRDVFLNNLMFTGFRADFTKAFSAAPLFQTAHNFTMGSAGMPPYSFAALYGSPKVE